MITFGPVTDIKIRMDIKISNEMLDKIIVPVDSITFDNTLLAVENAIDLTKSQAEGKVPDLVFLHVWNVESDGLSASDEKRLKRLRKSEISREFEEIQEMCEEEEIESYKTVFREGSSADEEIIKAANEENADLIVLGSGNLHDRTVKGKIKKFIYGSVTEKVIHKAPCSVYVVRPEE